MKTKGNDGSGNNINRDDWETPKWLFDKLNQQYHFNYDCCTNGKNSKCEGFSQNFLMHVNVRMDCIITESVYWMNPPFSKASEMFEHFFKEVDKGVAIYRCDNLETKIWQDLILKNADWIFIPNKRINYEGKKGNGSRFPSALIGKGLDPIKNLEGVTLFLGGNKK